jgi:bacillithiol biosynthesis cysteine-adding enzyme BshC
VTANASSSSVGSLPDALRVDLVAAGLLPPLPRAFLGGGDLDLLAPLRFLAPGQLPSLASTPAVSSAAGARPAGAAGGQLRAELAAALLATNRFYGHLGAEGACKRLADPATRVVVAGQQPGLFGGPLMTFAKLVAAARWAAALEAAGEPAVAVFWVATEDHDYAEVASATVLTADGPRSFDLGPDTQPLLPVGMRALSPAVTEVLRAIAEAVPGERYAEWLRTLARWYQPEARFGESFCRVMAHMLGSRCPLMLDAMHPALKQAEKPWLARLIERRGQLAAALARQDAAVQARGYELRVNPQPGASPLFLLRHGQRRRIEWRGDEGYALRGTDGADRARGAAGTDDQAGAGGVSELLRILDENPAVVSPGVLARPAVADAVLGTTLQVLGPGELSYMPQAAAVYDVLEIAAPYVALRPQTLVLDPGKAQHLEGAGLTLAELLGERSRLDRTLAERAGGDFVAPVRGRIAAALDELRAPALEADPNLERPLAKTREQVLRAVDLFAEKAMPSLARRDELQSRRVEALRQLCLPGGKPQERVVCAAHFQGKYGDRLAASFWEQLELDPTLLAVILP